jgi:hypothetical protein
MAFAISAWRGYVLMQSTVAVTYLLQSADGELLLWSVKDGGAGLVDGREGRDVQWATHTVTGNP